MRKKADGSQKRLMALVWLCLVFFSFAGCVSAKNARSGGKVIVSCFDDKYAPYSEVLARALPNCGLERSDRVFHSMETGAEASEAFDVQAMSSLEHGASDYWYPHYLATVVIAVDRDRTDADILGWRDLPAANETVGICGGSYKNQMVFSAIAYGLEGENYTLTRAAELLAKVRKKGGLVENSFEPPIVLCFDFQAAAMKKEGRGIEIIVPREGTLSFERGLLSNTELGFFGDLDSLLIEAGYRLTDGRCDGALYPYAAAYESAARVLDYDRFNTVCLDGDRVFRRDVMGVRLYSSADGREHQFFALVYMILLIVWIASVFRRTMQKSVRSSILITGIILLSWIIVRLIKFQILEESTLNRYLWYSYYLFQLALPLLALWLAWAVDRPDGKLTIPKWLRGLTALNSALLIIVFTNDLHDLVFRLDLSNANWAKEYSYGFVYWIVLAAGYLPLAVAVFWMLLKSRRNPRKRVFVFPLVFVGTLILYGAGYAMKIPVATESDITMVTGLLILMFTEAMIRVGMMPANKKYTAFFTHSPLRMRIIGGDGKTALASAKAVTEHCGGVLAEALAAYPSPLHPDENTLLFAAGIGGGSVIWEEDVSDLNLLHKEVEESVGRLAAANAVLAEDERIKRAIAEETEKIRLMTLLETEIAGHAERLSSMAERLGSAADRQRETVLFTLLLSYVKRRCNLFFKEQESQTVSHGEFTGYLGELADIAAYSDIKIIVTNQIYAPLPPREATLFYDFFYDVAAWAARQDRTGVLAYLHSEDGAAIMKLIPVADTASYFLDPGLSWGIATTGGAFAREDIDGAVVVSLSFPGGGAVDE